MKKHIIIYILMITGISVMSCSKTILNTSPNNEASTASMWTTDNLTDQGVAGVYAALRQGGSGNLYMLYELYSMDRFGMTGQDYDNGNNGDGLLTATVTPNSGYFTNTWTYLYEGIKRANDAIYYIPRISPYDSVTKARYVAECKFLRAYFYFRLAEVFKNVPIYTVNPESVNGYTNAASSQDSVWLQCISDLTDAINTPTSTFPLFYAQTAANAGRATKGAAYALRGEIYMWEQQYANAINDFQQVQNAGYQLYTGSGDSSYKMLFKATQNNCPEMIFEMQNLGVSGYGGTSEFYEATRSFYGQGWDWLSPSNDLVDMYENADGSQFSWDNIIPGYNEMTSAAREVFFIRDNATQQELSAAQSRGADIALYDPVNNESRVAAAYANRDPRLGYTVITPYSSWLGASTNTTPQLYTWRWPYRTGNSPTFDIQSDVPTKSLYWYRKFVFEGVSEGILRAAVGINYPIIRYADVLLQWAEAINESQGPTQQALNLINQVRERAGMPDLTLSGTGPNVVSGQADLRNRIRYERRVELSNEGVEFFDELRYGIWKQVKFYAGNGAKEVWGTVLAPYTWQGDYITTWPAPETVTQMNKNIPQTPGWVY